MIFVPLPQRRGFRRQGSLREGRLRGLWHVRAADAVHPQQNCARPLRHVIHADD